jgi:hypothetical protein
MLSTKYGVQGSGIDVTLVAEREAGRVAAVMLGDTFIARLAIRLVLLIRFSIEAIIMLVTLREETAVLNLSLCGSSDRWVAFAFVKKDYTKVRMNDFPG